jgi:inosine-uridine nucleoside N-ribohydrolase
VTRQVPATADRRAQVREIGSPVAIMAADLLDFFSLQVQRIFNLPGGAMHDPLAVAVLLDPEVVTFQRMHVAIELRGEHTYGMTICDNRYIHMSEQEQAESSVKRGGPANALVATAVNPDRFWEIFLAALKQY